MSMTTVIKTLKNKLKNKYVLPRTVLKAVADDNGNYLDNGLSASDVNILKNGKISSMVTDISNNTSAINAIIKTTVFEFDYQQSFTGFLNSIWQNTYSVLGIEKSKIKGAIAIGESWISFSCFLAEASLIVQANSYYDYGSTSFHAKLVIFHSS